MRITDATIRPKPYKELYSTELKVIAIDTDSVMLQDVRTKETITLLKDDTVTLRLTVEQ